MSDTHQIVFLKAGDDSPANRQTVAEKISTASKTPVETLLKQIEGAPFVYKRGLPKAKAEAISAALNRLGAVTEVTPDGAPIAPAAGPADAAYDFGGPPADGGVSGFDFGGPPADSGSSFDVGGTPADSGGGFDFGSPADASDAPAVGGFSPAGTPAGSDEFAIEDPAPSAPNSAGFDFSVDAAETSPAPPMVEPDVAVERNLDYASSSGQEEKAPPPVQRPKTVTCPRCNEQVPEADECSACGVVLNKAGETAAQPRKPRSRRAVKKKKKSATPIFAALGLIIGGMAVAFVLGAFNPVRLMLRVKSEAILKDFGVELGPPDGEFATAIVSDDERTGDILEGFIQRGQMIEQEIVRLSGLSDVAQFDAGVGQLTPEMQAFAGHDAVALQAAIRSVNSGLYPIRGTGLTVAGTTYAYYADLEVDGAPSGATPLLSEPAMRRKIDEARQRVALAEEVRTSREEAESVNIDFNDSFATTIDPRWREEGPAGAAQQTQGWLYISATPDELAAAPRLVIPEPLVDYTAEVTVDGELSPDTNAGLVLIAAPDSFVALTRVPGRRGTKAQIVTKYGAANDTTTTNKVQLRIVRRGDMYTFSVLKSGRWTQLDQYKAFDGGPRRRLGLTAFGGQGGAFFGDFRVTIHR